MKNNLLMFLSIFIIYIIVDIVYQFTFGLNFSSSAYEEAGLSNILASKPKYPITLLLFFVLIAFCAFGNRRVQKNLTPSI